ncbi:hypothetical protein [Chitinophaga ginsengisoli]|uniref:Uncharacterized protein n=1 Tax=Chitinophaga ginsengisoli TaxID=363837 RepID=A0A2P8GCP2_9BACT|nr:hypothetical protein [Chitinophaga ginsengisoli]PSL31717.1 hypothetical protein CLV42_1049 [Chitinophaga ginsengisoli]
MSQSIEKIKQFMDWYPEAAEVKSTMWNLLEAAMASPNADTWSANDRSNMMFFYSRIEEFVDATYMIVPPLLQILHSSEVNE